MEITVIIPRIGTIFHVPELNRRNGFEKDNQDISWEILSTATYQDNDGNINTICTMLALDADANDLGIESETIDLALYDHKHV